MNLYLKVAVGLILLVQALHSASLQNSTDSPGRPIDSSWWRKLDKIKDGGEFPFSPEEYEHKGNAMEYSNEYFDTASGSMMWLKDEEENVDHKDKDANDSDHKDVASTALPHNVTSQQPAAQNSTDTPELASTDQTNSSIANATEAEKGLYNSTQSAANATSLPDFSNHTDSNMITLAPEVNATQEATTNSQNGTRSRNATESINKTTITPSNQTMIPETTHAPTIPTSTAPPASTEISSSTPTVAPTVAPTTSSKKTNETDKAAASGSSSDRGLASDSSSRRHSSWGAILGTAVAVICVGLVAYVILKHKHKKDFSHRKLVEEFPSDPVLRLDNNEPLDLNFGGSAYYNPALQGDNIQMTNFPRRP